MQNVLGRSSGDVYAVGGVEFCAYEFECGIEWFVGFGFGAKVNASFSLNELFFYDLNCILCVFSDC